MRRGWKGSERLVVARLRGRELDFHLEALPFLQSTRFPDVLASCNRLSPGEDGGSFASIDIARP